MLFLPFALAVWGEPTVAAVVALSLFASCSIATAVALTLPSLLHRLGHDPAFGSGPLATVIQDLLSLLIYFGIAAPAPLMNGSDPSMAGCVLRSEMPTRLHDRLESPGR